ncbi:7-carboxy-7-deazaguanine synthase QueE [Streptomyces sp. SAS_267]|uniref:7-carboxy-7-deazaguanine synthase QueE n=1 Tax=unclassified Streptomyces TaxID=2593676 RepID=UPI002E2BE679|nr:7-carboxy-7-deazaguanine synthase QueE [Streptomyces sp. NBC_00328]
MRSSAPPSAFQGEGRSIGRRCAFVRLGGCNLSCRWCDTPYTWDWTGSSDTGIKFDPKKELHRMPVGTVAEKLLAYGVELVVISGGEPLNQQNRLVPLVDELMRHGVEIEIETNGTRVPDERLIEAGVRFNVSPKLSHAGDPVEQRIVPDALRSLARLPSSTFKFVCRELADLDEVAEVADAFGITSVWIMPEGQTSEEVNGHMQKLVSTVIDRGWNTTTRLHTLVWGQKRGV